MSLPPDTKDPSCLCGLGALLLLALVIVILALSSCTVTYDGATFNATANGRDIARALIVLSEK